MGLKSWDFCFGKNRLLQDFLQKVLGKQKEEVQ